METKNENLMKIEYKIVKEPNRRWSDKANLQKKGRKRRKDKRKKPKKKTKKNTKRIHVENKVKKQWIIAEEKKEMKA